MKTPLLLLACAFGVGLASVVIAQTPAAPAAGSTTPASNLPPDVQAALDRARAAMTAQSVPVPPDAVITPLGATASGRTFYQLTPGPAGAPPGSSTLPPAPSSTAATADLPALRVAVTQVSESRNNNTSGRGGGGGGGGSTSLTLAITGEGLPPTATVRQVIVTKAEDNRGRSLLAGAGGPGGGGGGGVMPASVALSRMQSTLSSGRGGMGPLQGTATLATAERAAASITFVEGMIEIFLPSTANGSMLLIPNILSHAGRLEEPVLTKHGIEITLFIDQESSDEVTAMVAATTGGGRGGGGVGGVSSVATFSGTAPTTTVIPPFGFYMKDPSGMFAAWRLQDSSGNVIPTGGWSRSGGSPGNSTTQIRLNNPLPKDAQLLFYLNVPEAVRAVPFRLEDIQLP